MENPLRTWWKVRKWFRIPKPSIYFGPIISGLPCKLPDKWIELYIYDVSWKDKYNSPRHERNPYVWICLFRLFRFEISTRINTLTETGKVEDRSMFYWEYLLNYLYYSKSLKINQCWEHSSKEIGRAHV